MALSELNTYDIYEGLKHNFLFNKDVNCIHMLLNLYDLENNINNIYPKYISMDFLRKKIRKLLNDKRGNHLIAYNLSELIHEDINRLELFIYLEGYKNGYLNNKNTNLLEDITLKYYPVGNLYNMKYLFHYKIEEDEIRNFKSWILENLYNEEKNTRNLFETINNYCNDIIKPRVLSLNKFLDKQLSLDIEDITFNIREEDAILTLAELNKIYEEVLNIVLRNGQKLYYKAYWNGLNDRVLRRYR